MFEYKDRRISDRRRPETSYAHGGFCQRNYDRRKMIYDDGYKYIQNGIDVTEFIRNGNCTLVSTRFHPIIKQEL